VSKLAAFFPRFQAHVFATKHGAYGGWAKQNIGWFPACYWRLDCRHHCCWCGLARHGVILWMLRLIKSRQQLKTASRPTSIMLFISSFSRPFLPTGPPPQAACAVCSLFFLPRLWFNSVMLSLWSAPEITNPTLLASMICSGVVSFLVHFFLTSKVWSREQSGTVGWPLF
jgi:hypothetical protein